MRIRNFALSCLLLTCLVFIAACDEKSMDDNLVSAIEEDSSSLTAMRIANVLRIRINEGGLLAVNGAAGFETRFNANELVVSDRNSEWTLTWQTTGIGREDNLATVEPVTPELGECDKQTPDVCSPMATYQHATFSEWYANRAGGLEQGWTIASRPAGNSRLMIEGAIGGSLSAAMAEDGERVIFSRGDRDVLIYSGLHVTDASGRELPARMELRQATIRLVIDDTQAVYPLTVDPGLSPAPAWSLPVYPSAISSGDINGDGYIDAVVLHDQLRAYYGSANGLSSFANWTSTLSVYDKLDATGDFNGDGYDDVVASNWGASAVNVFYGTASGPSPDSDWAVVKGGNFGDSLASAGDINGDGYDDLVVGAATDSSIGDENGAAYVFYGSATGLSTTEGWSYFGSNYYDNLGQIVSAAGDLNGDGYDDVLVTWDYNVDVFYGSGGGLATTPAWTNTGFSCTSLAPAGDVNGDGYDDFLIGNFRQLKVNLFLGSASGPSGSPVQTFSLDQAASVFGYNVSSAGDVNADGYDDVMIGAYMYDNSETNEGAVFLYYGSTDGPSTTPGLTLEGNLPAANFSIRIASAGDVNLDGYDDILIGTANKDNNGVLLYLGGCKTGCVYSDQCYTDGNALPGNECLVCQATSWTPNDGATCDDGLYCNGEDACRYGYCAEHAGDPCESNGVYCDGEETCNEQSDSCETTNVPCLDDGQFCNGAESCNEAEAICEHTGDPCSDPYICDEGGDECSSTCKGCWIDGVCYHNTQANPDNECQSCQVAVSTVAWSNNDGASCDDGVFCNGDDVCKTGICDKHDGDPCDSWETCNEETDACDLTGDDDDDDDDNGCGGNELGFVKRLTKIGVK